MGREDDIKRGISERMGEGRRAGEDVRERAETRYEDVKARVSGAREEGRSSLSRIEHEKSGLPGWVQAVLWISCIGAINWGLVGFFNWNLVNAIFGGETSTPASGLSRFVYALVGLCGLGGIVGLVSHAAHAAKPMQMQRTSPRAV